MRNERVPSALNKNLFAVLRTVPVAQRQVPAADDDLSGFPVARFCSVVSDHDSFRSRHSVSGGNRTVGRFGVMVDDKVTVCRQFGATERVDQQGTTRRMTAKSHDIVPSRGFSANNDHAQARQHRVGRQLVGKTPEDAIHDGQNCYGLFTDISRKFG